MLITAGAGGLGHFAVQIARILGAEVVATASPQHHEFLHRLGAAVVIDHTRPDWPDKVRDAIEGGAERVLACAAPTLDGAAQAARDGALIATPVHADFPDGQRVRWQSYNGQARGSPADPDGPLVRRRIADRHRAGPVLLAQRRGGAPRGAESGHTQGKLALIVDTDLAASLEV